MAMARAMQAIMAQAPQWVASYKTELAGRGLGFSADDIAAIEASATAHPLPAGGTTPSAEDMEAIQRTQAKVAETVFPETGLDPNHPSVAPINGISLAAYAVAAKAIGWANEDRALVERVTTALGFGAADWEAAQQGWTQRCTDDMVVATMYGQLFTNVGELPRKP
ncbi:hypothetical protein GCM10027448_10310 [Nocardioides dilutus]